MTTRAHLLAGAAAAFVATNTATTFITEPPPPSPTDPGWPGWFLIASESPLGPGWQHDQLFINIGLFFGPTAGCACGFGYSGPPLGSLTNPTVRVYQYTPDWRGGPPLIGEPIPPFDTLTFNETTTAFLNSEPPFEGANWIGFAGIVQLDAVAGDHFAIGFEFDLTVADGASLAARILCAAGGLATVDGIPLLQLPVHPFTGPFGCSPDQIPADLDHDGIVGATDLGILLGEWGFAGSQADLNHDGTVDAADLSILLGAWG
ncbi:MAG: hypothetical protein U0572_14495 [Phycisphaerales bacterium]